MSTGLRDLFREVEQAPDKVGRRVQQVLEAAVTAKLEDEQVELLEPGKLLDINLESGFRKLKTRDQLLVALCLVETEEDFREMRPYLLFSLHHPHWSVRRAAVFAALDHGALWDDVLRLSVVTMIDNDPHPIINTIPT